MKNKRELSIGELCSLQYRDKKLVVPLGYARKKKLLYINFERISGLFIAGATGTGKSVFIDDLIVGLMYKNMPKDSENGLVIGFNHPSLGEIARILTMKIDIMGDKPMYFPVNLPWYEALAPNFDRIKRLGIIITPTITPSTWKKMDLMKK